MTNAGVVLTDINGVRYAPGHVFSLDCGQSWETPADSMELSFLCESALPQMHLAQLVCEGKTLFSGLVDKQSVLRDKSGMLAKIYARGIAAGALDNEALPQVYGRISLREVFARHLEPHGLTLQNSRNAYLEGYTVAKGTSDWEAFTGFCALCLSQKAFARGSGVFVGVPDAVDTVSLGSASGILSVEHVFDRYDVISDVLLRDKQGLYSAQVKNEEAAKLQVRRRRYLISDAAWTRLPALDAREKIRASMLGYSTVKLTLAGLRAISVGDYADISDAVVSKSGLFVLEVKHTVSQAGLLTRLTLCDPKYL